jgi:hypothetical protein
LEALLSTKDAQGPHRNGSSEQGRKARKLEQGARLEIDELAPRR